jgi:hypothetical protein
MILKNQIANHQFILKWEIFQGTVYSRANTSQFSGIIPDDVNTLYHNTNKKNISQPVALIGRNNVTKMMLERLEDDFADFSMRAFLFPSEMEPYTWSASGLFVPTENLLFNMV